MKKFILLLSYCYLSCISCAYAKLGQVGPSEWLTATLINYSNISSSLGDSSDELPNTVLEINTNGGDVIDSDTDEISSNHYSVAISVIQDDKTKFYIEAQNYEYAKHTNLCEFELLIDHNGHATLSEKDLFPAEINCQLVGDPNNNLTITTNGKFIPKNH